MKNHMREEPPCLFDDPQRHHQGNSGCHRQSGEPEPLQGGGTSRAIYQAAGEQELTAACEAIGHCEPGRAVCTPAFGQPAVWNT
ncbi:MAG: macro domain-containing protein [Faecalibacterium sp.]